MMKMNEKIKLLAEQAGMFVDESGDVNSPGTVLLLDGNIPKFAELIVQECISVLEEQIYQSMDEEGDEIWADLILKEHFGVEK